MFDFSKIVFNFNVNGSIVSCERYGEGHINETFLLIMQNGEKTEKYILQKINGRLFKDVEKLMNNIVLVTEHVRAKVKARGGDPDRESLSVVYARDGKPYFHSLEYGEYFRVYVFIDNAIAHQCQNREGQFYQSAVAFGNFANDLADFDASQLYEILPDFHNTEKRYCDFTRSLSADKYKRASSVLDEIRFVTERKDYCKSLVNLIKTGDLPLKVTHNDTKLNNVMLDEITDAPVAVIDLDTVMPGTICYDFGDSIRFGCNTAAEDERDLSKVNFDIALFEEYTRGYLSALSGTLTLKERENLALGAILMTFECGMRFLADYLDGDVYFRTHREGHNLDRARTQFKLVRDMEASIEEMKEIVRRF